MTPQLEAFDHIHVYVTDLTDPDGNPYEITTYDVEAAK